MLNTEYINDSVALFEIKKTYQIKKLIINQWKDKFYIIPKTVMDILLVFRIFPRKPFSIRNFPEKNDEYMQFKVIIFYLEDVIRSDFPV